SRLLFFYCAGGPLCRHSFPTRRSSDLNSSWHRSRVRGGYDAGGVLRQEEALCDERVRRRGHLGDVDFVRRVAFLQRRSHEVYVRSEEHTSELQSLTNIVCRLLLEKKN